MPTKFSLKLLALLLAVSFAIVSCSHAKEKVVVPNTLHLNFEKNLQNAQLDQILTGFVENDLFGKSGISIDENQVSNRKLKIFFFLKKANRPNAPYVVSGAELRT